MGAPAPLLVFDESEIDFSFCRAVVAGLGFLSQSRSFILCGVGGDLGSPPPPDGDRSRSGEAAIAAVLEGEERVTLSGDEAAEDAVPLAGERLLRVDGDAGGITLAGEEGGVVVNSCGFSRDELRLSNGVLFVIARLRVITAEFSK